MLGAHALCLDPAGQLPARSGEAGEGAERRDFGRIAEPLDLRAHRIGGQLAAPVDAECLAELDLTLQLEAVIVRLALAISINRQVVVLDLAGRRLEDEVGEAVVIDAALDVHRAGRALDVELEAVAFLELEIGIADQELLAAAVWTE